jgi:hypothetical protein
MLGVGPAFGPSNGYSNLNEGNAAFNATLQSGSFDDATYGMMSPSAAGQAFANAAWNNGIHPVAGINGGAAPPKFFQQSEEGGAGMAGVAPKPAAPVPLPTNYNPAARDVALRALAQAPAAAPESAATPPGAPAPAADYSGEWDRLQQRAAPRSRRSY